MRKTKYLKSNMNNSRLLGLKFVRALNNYSKWRRFWTSPVQVTKNLESSRLACTGIPSTTGSPKITKRSPNVERNDSDDNDTHQQATSNNVTTDSDPALEFDTRKNDKLNSNEEENDDPLNEYRAPVCETYLESIIPNYPVVNAQVNRSIRSPSECPSSV